MRRFLEGRQVKFTYDESLKRRIKKWQKAARGYKSDMEKLKRNLAVTGLSNLYYEVTRRGLRHKGGLVNSFSYKILPDGVEFTSGAKYSSYLEKGIRQHIMHYLRKAKGPIPIKVKNFTPRGRNSGQIVDGVIFRTPTAKSFRRKGAWTHPGFYRGKGFFRSAMKKTLKDATKELRALNRKYYG
jgi:hypothetical protein